MSTLDVFLRSSCIKVGVFSFLFLPSLSEKFVMVLQRVYWGQRCGMQKSTDGSWTLPRSHMIGAFFEMQYRITSVERTGGIGPRCA